MIVKGKLLSSPMEEIRHDGLMFSAMDSYWGSLHCVRTFIVLVPLLTQMYKWVLVTEWTVQQR